MNSHHGEEFRFIILQPTFGGCVKRKFLMGVVVSCVFESVQQCLSQLVMTLPFVGAINIIITIRNSHQHLWVDESWLVVVRTEDGGRG